MIHFTSTISNPIGWCDDTTNAVTGCDKVSPGCKNCYAAVGTRARVLRAQGIETWGANGVRHPVAQFAQKLRRLNKLCICDQCHEAHSVERLKLMVESGTAGGTPAARCKCGGQLRHIRLFADSNSDWLDEKWPMEVFANFLNEIRNAPNVDVLLLTKRPENCRPRLYDAIWQAEGLDPDADTDQYECKTDLGKWIDGWLHDGPPQGVWLGVSVENQAMADLRIPQLLTIPAAVRFLSCEPLLEKVSFRWASWKPIGQRPGEKTNHLDGLRMLDWVIVGGESGKGRRDCGVEAIINVAEQCKEAGVPVYVKQDCAFKSGEKGRIPGAFWALKQFPKSRAMLGAPKA